jgi:RecJ-like exonuclease
MDQLDHQAVDSNWGRSREASLHDVRPHETVPQRQTRPVELIMAARCAEVPESDKAAILELLVRVNDTFSTHDVEGHLDTFVFPAVRFARGKVHVLTARETATQSIMTTGLSPNYWRSEWERLEVLQAGQDKVHVAAVASHQRRDGREFDRDYSLYVIERSRGVWGVRAHSHFPK